MATSKTKANAKTKASIKKPETKKTSDKNLAGLKSTTNPIQSKSNSIKILLPLLGLILIFATVIGVINYKNSIKVINDYYSTNDKRRGEKVYENFKANNPKQKIVVSNFGLINFTYSLIHENIQASSNSGPNGENNSPNQIFVETFYLKRKNLVNFEVTKSYRTSITNMSFEDVVKLAKGRDLHIDNPDREKSKKDIVNELVADLSPEEQVQYEEQQKAQQEQLKAQAEYEALPTDQKIVKLEAQVQEIQEFSEAIKKGETTFKGRELPKSIDPSYLNQLNQALEGTKAEIERLRSEAKAAQ
jgi:predicted nucleic-acid-binding protein